MGENTPSVSDIRAVMDASEMTNNQMHKNKLMKIAEREKEHYKMAKEMLENKM